MLSVVVIVLLMVPWRALCKWRPKPGEGMEVNHFSSEKKVHKLFQLRREVQKRGWFRIQLRREVRKRGWFRIKLRREVHELPQRGPRRMSVGV